MIEKFRRAIGLDKQTNSRALVTNGHLQLLGSCAIYSLGDCATVQQPRLLAKLADLFRAADKNGSNTLDYEELRAFLREQQLQFPQLAMMGKEILASIKPDEVMGIEQFKQLMAAADSRLRALPATAQVAAQQGEYLAKLLSSLPLETATAELETSTAPQFHYKHLGSLAYVGGDEAIADFKSDEKVLKFLNLSPMSGWGTYWLWRSIYFSELFSTRNRAQLAFDWTRSKIFGRDISRD